MFVHMCQCDPNMTAEIPTIATPRLMLRPLQLSDAGAVQILFPQGSGAKLVGISRGVISGLNFNKPIRRLAAAEGDNANDDRYSKRASW